MPTVTAPSRAVQKKKKDMNNDEKAYAEQAERLGQYTAPQENDTTGSTRAVEAKFITAQDPVIETANGGRLPTVPLDEAIVLNKLRDKIEGKDSHREIPESGFREAKDGTIHGAKPNDVRDSTQSDEPEAPLREQVPVSRTDPLFPPLPLYGPPTLMRTLQCRFFRVTSFILSLQFLLVIVLGAAFTSIPSLLRRICYRLTFRDPDSVRPFYHEEQKRQKAREEADQEWVRTRKHHRPQTPSSIEKDPKTSPDSSEERYIPTEGGPDPLICDVGYYARREGLDVETFQVQTEDGFIIELQHIYNPLTQSPSPSQQHRVQSPTVFDSATSSPKLPPSSSQPPRYPILLLHGLLQSSGAYACTGPSSLAFYLHKSGYDVWLGNNRCGQTPRHTLLSPSDPRMWAWNIRQMGVLDLTALISRVLDLTHFPKLALVAHSQGTTQTLVALAKEQRPDLGDRISVFCALAPAAYAGRLIGKAELKFMRVISPAMFRVLFGIHAFIPFMMTMHRLLPGGFYGDMGYLVFSFLFDWTDERWDKALRRRCFQFAPTYVSAESMRWWLGRECFARQKCILATREEGRLEDREDEEEEEVVRRYYEGGMNQHGRVGEELMQGIRERSKGEERGRYAWYDARFPPLAMWVCGNDDLVDGRRLLRRFDRGREPDVRVVHKKVIEGYEHLDVIWAVDVIEKVGREIKEVVWKTVPEEWRGRVRVVDGCADVKPYDLSRSEHVPNGPLGVSGGIDLAGGKEGAKSEGPVSPTMLDTTAGEWTGQLRHDRKAT